MQIIIVGMDHRGSGSKSMRQDSRIAVAHSVIPKRQMQQMFLRMLCFFGRRQCW